MRECEKKKSWNDISEKMKYFKSEKLKAKREKTKEEKKVSQ